jgi:hypothetical protein
MPLNHTRASSLRCLVLRVAGLDPGAASRERLVHVAVVGLVVEDDDLAVDCWMPPTEAAEHPRLTIAASVSLNGSAFLPAS